MLAWALLACGGGEPAGEAAPWTVCRPDEARLLAGRVGAQLVLEPCKVGQILAFAWAPDGLQLYFQLPMAPSILDANTGVVGLIPSTDPRGEAVWLDRERLAFPLDGGRIGIFTRTRAAVDTVETGLGAAPVLAAEDTTHLLAFGPAGVTRLDLASGGREAALDWLRAPVEEASVAGGRLAVRQGGVARVYDLRDGVLLKEIPDVLGLDLHPSGRWLAMARLGDPVSPYVSPTWAELKPEEAAKKRAELEAWITEKGLPATVRPPVISVLDLDSGAERTFEALLGTRPQWYPSGMNLSFVLWGFEGRQLDPNLVLVDLEPRMELH